MLKKFLLFVLCGKPFNREKRKQRLLERTYGACRTDESDNARRLLSEMLSEKYEAEQIGYFTSPKSIRVQAKARRAI